MRDFVGVALVSAACAGSPVEGQPADGDAGASGTAPGTSSDAGGTATQGDGHGSTAAASDSSGGASGSTTQPLPPPNCGDKIIDPDEDCDDGNVDNTDACTTLCRAPACDDGIVSGKESDLDCGGACGPCGIGLACKGLDDCEPASLCRGKVCHYPRSCLQLLEVRPAAPDGDYDIDPDGDNLGPLTLTCDMTGGGWTLVLYDDFEVDAAGWSQSSLDTCGPWTQMLGRFDNDTVEKTVDLLGITHTELRLRARAIIMDSWDDDEELSVAIDGSRLLTLDCWVGTPDECNQDADVCFNEFWPDGVVPIETTPSHSSVAALVTFDSNLDDNLDDESWGIDDVEVWVR